MDYTYAKGLSISKITLGTAQLGLNYGISNTTGKPNLEQANKIMDLALKYGINMFDTSPAYGDSEVIIGSYLKRNSLENSLNSIAKISHITKDSKYSSQEIYNMIKSSVIQSCRRLQIKQLPICLLHEPSDMQGFGDFVVNGLVRVKEEGLIKNIGVSIYTPDEVNKFLEYDELEVIEIPINIMDTRLIENGLLGELLKKRVLVFARSVFLQGLFFLDSQRLPHSLESARKPLSELKKLSNEINISIREIALTFVRDTPGISSMILGVETAVQLRENIKSIQSRSMSNEVRQRLLNIFNDIPDVVINPSLWKK